MAGNAQRLAAWLAAAMLLSAAVRPAANAAPATMPTMSASHPAAIGPEPPVPPPGPPPATRSAAAPDDELEQAASANLFADAIDFAQKRCVKIYGAGIGREHGYGTGILVSPDGMILTAQSIFVGGPNVRVVLPDGSVRAGDDVQIVKRHEALQVVIMKINARTPDYFDLPEKPVVQKGDWVAAVGNWFNVATGAERVSVNMGVVSLRAVVDTKRRMQDLQLEGDLLLVDAIVSNPGAPGGALMTADGKLAGMIGKIVESKSTGTRMNYAVPSDLLRELVMGREFGVTPLASVPKVFLGVKLFTLSGKYAAAFIDDIVPGSPAERAGLRKDDQVLQIGREIIRHCKDYQEELLKLVPGKEITLLVRRKNDVVSVRLTPDAIKSDKPDAPKDPLNPKDPAADPPRPPRRPSGLDGLGGVPKVP